jgi:hypothetical protein
MKKISTAGFILVVMNFSAIAQNKSASYPEPQYAQEVYALQKENNSLVRLEKESSKLENKVKAAGFGGSESGYNLKGEKSIVRFSSAQLPSFVFRSHAGYSHGDSASAYMANSRMMDEMMDPTKTITLYALDAKSGGRSLILQSSGGTFSKKQKSSDKYTLSFRIVKDGYYEMVVDKPLPKGEYGFMNAMAGVAEATLYLFGVD